MRKGRRFDLAESDAELGERDDSAKRLMRIDTRFALTPAALQKIGKASDERITRVAIRQQLRAYDRMDWASQSLRIFAGLLGESSTVEKRIYELREFGRRLSQRKARIR